jgi:xanthosine utilization system XapX-like protein
MELGETASSATSAASPAPWHLWVIGTVGLLWNAFGCYDYVMSKTSPETYLVQMGMGQETVDYMASFPAWLTTFWALGVWGSLAGSLLLLARSRQAVTAFAVSLFGLAVSQGYEMLFLRPPFPPPLAMVGTIWIALILQVIYAARMKRAGALT